jgi:ribosomal protein S15P/S13E
MSLTATLAASAAPAAVNLASNFLTSPKETAYEREMRSLAKYYKQQAANPYLQTAEGQSQMRALEETDERNRERSTSQGFRGNATNEAKTAGHQAANEAMAQGANQVAGNAGRYRSRKLSRYMQALGQSEQARSNSQRQWQQQVGAITEGAANVAAGYLQNKKDKNTQNQQGNGI